MKNTRPFDDGPLPILRRVAYWAGWLCSLGLPLSVHAFELGALRLEPGSGQTAAGQIVIKGEVDPGQTMAWVVSPEGYRAAGLNPQHSMQAIRITPFRAATGESRLRLEAVPLVPSRYDLLVIAGDSSGAKVSRYRIDANALAREIPGVPVSKQLLGSQEPRRAQTAPAATESGAAGAAARPASVPRIEADTSPSDRASRGRLAQASAAVEAWRQAWSARDFDAYIAAYAPTYTGRVAGRSREEWIRERKQRILVRRRISVDIADLQLAEREGSVVATFDQTYRAGELLFRSRKQLTLSPAEGGRWLIVGENELQ